MSIKDRFFHRKAQQPKKIPSGAYEDLINTRITTPQSYQDIEGPQTLMEDIEDQREPQMVERIPEEQQMRPSTQPSMSGAETQPDRLRFDPMNFDRRIYNFIKDIAAPKMVDAAEMLFYLQKALDKGFFGDKHKNNDTEFVVDVDEAIEYIDRISDHLSEEQALAFSRLDEADGFDERQLEEIEQMQQEWAEEGTDFKDMLSRIGDPFAPEATPSDPFAGGER